ncbi:hypothetical protein SASPL_123381 [Salvia splendens]|uniref:Uncharacterized protein n=1 Tax=Salvia splendens TaxID=180675 RepID=A0A8X8XLB4_SALSN|nr:uncharacterized protein LOC121743963 [Salvia splendens]KAG6415960.1 hypothetical protein SASPL_123381 [Salvia splendens]
MEISNRKPLSDITDLHNLTPLSVLRELISSNPTRKPPLSILRSNSNSLNRKLGPESSDRSNTSIGSSSVGASSISKTVRFRNLPNALSPPTSPGDIGTKNEAYSRRNNIENSNKEREAQVIDSRTSIEKRKDKRKATAVPFSPSASKKMKENRSGICNMSVTDGVMSMRNADQRKIIEKSRKEINSDLIGFRTPLTERKDKGKAVAMPYSSLPNGKLKEIQNNICNSSTLVERSCQKGEGNHSFSCGFAEDVKESNMDKLVSHSHSSGKTEKGKANINSSNAALGKQSEIAVAAMTRSSRKMKTSVRNNNAFGVSSCPTITRTKKLQNGLDEDVKHLNSWTDPQANRKKRPKTEKTSELPEEFIREKKAYYDDIDNFELPVEEVSQDESD